MACVNKARADQKTIRNRLEIVSKMGACFPLMPYAPPSVFFDVRGRFAAIRNRMWSIRSIHRRRNGGPGHEGTMAATSGNC